MTVKAGKTAISGYTHKFFFYLLVVLIPLSLFFILAELIARLLAPVQAIPHPPPPNAIDPHQPNPYIIKVRPYLFLHIPGSKYIQDRPNLRANYEINSQGFRGPEIPPQKPEGVKRLLVIGDSVVEGYGNEFTQTFSYLLGENLQPFGWEVINGGVQGASPIYFAANLERYLSLNPDAVLVVLYENDVPEDRLREDEYFKLPYLDNPGSLLQPANRFATILSLSRAYTGVQREWRKLLKSPVEQIIAQNQKTSASSLEQLALLRETPALVPFSVMDQQWDKSHLYLDYTVTKFQKWDISVLVTNLNIRTIQPDSPYYDHAHHLDERITAWSAEKQLPFLSLLPVIAQLYKKRDWSEITIKDDGHPTPETHAAIEATLRPWLLHQLGLK